MFHQYFVLSHTDNYKFQETQDQVDMVRENRYKYNTSSVGGGNGEAEAGGGSGGDGGGGGDQLMMSSNTIKPAWLEGLMAETFFGGCGVHENRRKNEKNIFCLLCCLSICPHCLFSHRSHPLLQVYNPLTHAYKLQIQQV